MGYFILPGILIDFTVDKDVTIHDDLYATQASLVHLRAFFVR